MSKKKVKLDKETHLQEVRELYKKLQSSEEVAQALSKKI